MSFCCRRSGGPAAVRVRPQLSAALAADLQSADSGSLPRTPMSPSDDQDEAAHEADSAAFWLANQVGFFWEDKIGINSMYKTAHGWRALDGALGLSAAERPLHCSFLLEHAAASAPGAVLSQARHSMRGTLCYDQRRAVTTSPEAHSVLLACLLQVLPDDGALPDPFAQPAVMVHPESAALAAMAVEQAGAPLTPPGRRRWHAASAVSGSGVSRGRGGSVAAAAAAAAAVLAVDAEESAKATAQQHLPTPVESIASEYVETEHVAAALAVSEAPAAAAAEAVPAATEVTAGGTPALAAFQRPGITRVLSYR